MEKYRLKNWYPSLASSWRVDDVIIIKENDYEYYAPAWGIDNSPRVPAKEVENNPDFWELIEEKKPLFTTEDGVNVLSDIDNLYAVNLTYFNKTKNTLRHSSWLIENSAYKVFYHEANADEYIWRNMRLFSYEDMMKAKHSNILTYEDIEKAAKERVER